MAQIHEDLEEDFLVLLAFVLCWWMLNCLLMCYLLWLLDTSVHTLVNPGLWFFLKKINISGLISDLDCFWVYPDWLSISVDTNDESSTTVREHVTISGECLSEKKKKISGEWPVTLRCHLQMFIRSSSYCFRVLLRFHSVWNASCVYWILVALACMLSIHCKSSGLISDAMWS